MKAKLDALLSSIPADQARQIRELYVALLLRNTALNTALANLVAAISAEHPLPHSRHVDVMLHHAMRALNNEYKQAQPSIPSSILKGTEE